jgi:hypothetical protein
MKIKDIKVGKMYQTNIGIGVCKAVGGTFPPTVKIDIQHPFPRGVVNVKPRDVQHEITTT